MDRYYHIGFGKGDLGATPPTLAILSGDPDRASLIAQKWLHDSKVLSENRGLASYLGNLPNGRPVISATSGMGAPSLSIVVNELVQVGIRTIIRVGTCGSIQDHVRPGSVVISQAALARQGAANDIAPPEYPASADPFLTLALVEAAKAQGIEYHLGITASVDTFYEGQERTDSANPHQFRALGAAVLVGEVSTVNDDLTDNRFYDPVGRFPTVEEDEEPYRLLVSDYSRYYRDSLAPR